MSGGQLPRWKTFYPRMKDRGRYRRRKPRVAVWTADWKPVWPPTITVDGVSVRVDMNRFQVCGRMYRDGYWVDETTDKTEKASA